METLSLYPLVYSVIGFFIGVLVVCIINKIRFRKIPTESLKRIVLYYGKTQFDESDIRNIKRFLKESFPALGASVYLTKKRDFLKKIEKELVFRRSNINAKEFLKNVMKTEREIDKSVNQRIIKLLKSMLTSAKTRRDIDRMFEKIVDDVYKKYYHYIVNKNDAAKMKLHLLNLVANAYKNISSKRPYQPLTMISIGFLKRRIFDDGLYDWSSGNMIGKEPAKCA